MIEERHQVYIKCPDGIIVFSIGGGLIDDYYTSPISYIPLMKMLDEVSASTRPAEDLLLTRVNPFPAPANPDGLLDIKPRPRRPKFSRI